MEGERNDVGSSLVGLEVERVDRPSAGLFAITVRGHGVRGALLIAAGPPRRTPDWAIVAERPRGDPADGTVRGLREKLDGARITSAWRRGTRLGIEVDRGEMRWRVEATTGGLKIVPSDDGNIDTTTHAEAETLTVVDLNLARARGERFVGDHASQIAEDRRIDVRRTLKALRSKLERRCVAIDGDRQAIVEAEAKAERAALFVPAAARAPRGATRLVATDWSRGEAAEIVFELDPAKSAREQLDALFARARRLRNGTVQAQRRRDDAEIAMLMIDDALEALNDANESTLTQLTATLRRELPGDIRLPVAPRAPALRAVEGGAGRLPYRAFKASSGEQIWVGRSSRDNDDLTLHFARLGDLWLHVRGRPGAHVVLRREGSSASPNALVDAATLTAHFSEQRGEGVVDVVYCERRYVMKRRGTPAGSVEVKKESVLAVRIEPDRLAKLLDSEGRLRVERSTMMSR
jgi:predicted ribosome quality control (RQC) complex YloA/Tae2 family protein